MFCPAILGAAVLAATLWPTPTTPLTPTSRPVAAGRVSERGLDRSEIDTADLEGTDLDRRLAAIVRLGALGQPAGLRRLVTLLDHPDSPTRLAAARALVRAGDPDTLERVAAQASDPSAPRRLEALILLREAARLPAPARHASERDLADADPAMRLAALELLAQDPQGSSVPALVPAVADSNRDVRLAALRLLGKTPDVRALLPLVERLDTTDRTERILALQALAGFRHLDSRLDAGPAVLRQVGDPNDDVRMAAIETIGRLGWEPAVALLRTVAASPSQDRVARRAALALGRIGGGPAIAVLAQLLRQPDPPAEVSAALIQAGAAAVPPLSDVLRDGLSTSAVAAARILAAIGSPTATVPLSRTLTSSATPAVAIAAARALATLGDATAVPALMEAFRRNSGPGELPSAGVQEACLDALAAIGDGRAAELVEPAARNGPAAALRAAGLRLAASLRRGLSRDTLLARLRDGDPLVRDAAVHTAALFPALRPAPALITAVRALNTGENGSPAAPAAELTERAAALADALEATVTAADRPRLVQALIEDGPARDAPLLRALAALPAQSWSPPTPLGMSLVRTLSQGGAPARAAAEVLSAFAANAEATPGLLARLPALEPAVRARLCPALERAGAGRLVDELAARDSDPTVRAAATWTVRARALITGAGTAPRPWLRVRLVASDPSRLGGHGSPLAGQWVRLRAGGSALWLATDAAGEAYLADLPAGPYRLSAASAAQAARTAAMASGKSPATTPAAP